MTDYKYNEVEYAKLIYSKGLQTKHIFTELKILAIYLKNTYGYKPKQLREELYKYCEEFFPGYNRAKHYKLINSVLSQANKKNSCLIQIDKIDITTFEMNYITNIPIDLEESVKPLYDHECRKLLFTLLVQMKLNRKVCEIRKGKIGKGIYFQGGVKKYNELKKIAKLNNDTKINEEIIHILSQNELIEIKYNGLIKLSYIETMNKQYCTSNTVVTVANFDNIGWYYDYCTNIPKMRLCKHCYQPFKQTRKDLLYCPDHKGYQPIKTKLMICTDCGVNFTVNGNVKNKKRCDYCQSQYIKIYDRQRKRNKIPLFNSNLTNSQTQ